jgi:histidine triad (HIT) family protein
VIGLEVPHAHVHLIPINSLNDCNFNNQKLKFTTEEFKSIAAQIAQNIKH